MLFIYFFLFIELLVCVSTATRVSRIKYLVSALNLLLIICTLTPLFKFYSHFTIYVCRKSRFFVNILKYLVTVTIFIQGDTLRHGGGGFIQRFLEIILKKVHPFGQTCAKIPRPSWHTFGQTCAKIPRPSWHNKKMNN